MSREPERERSAAQYSPDGRWYWDGVRWLPIPPVSANPDGGSGIGTRSWGPGLPPLAPEPAPPRAVGALPSRPMPVPAPHSPVGRRLLLAMAPLMVMLIFVVVILVTMPTIIGLTEHGTPRPTPIPRVNPGTYSAGSLRAPATLGGQPRTPTVTKTDAAELRQDRDVLARAAGGPAIAVPYGAIYLRAAQGYVTDEQFFGNSPATYGDFGPVRCGTITDTICFRSDPSQRLVVSVEEIGDPQQLAATTNEAWTDLGGH